MKEPKNRYYFLLLKKSQFHLIPRIRYVKELRWKDKYNTPRVEWIPTLSVSWLFFQFDRIKGSDEEWEWYLWVTKYSDGDIEKAIRSWPWKSRDSETGEFIKHNPNLTYNK